MECLATSILYMHKYSRTSIIRPSIIRNLDYPALHYPEPRLSGPPLSGTSIIRLGSLLVIRSENGRVPQTRMRVAAVTMETCLLIFCACAYNHVALLCFINEVGGSRCGLSIRLSGIIIHLSGLLLEPRCPDNRGSTVHTVYVEVIVTMMQCIIKN